MPRSRRVCRAVGGSYKATTAADVRACRVRTSVFISIQPLLLTVRAILLTSFGGRKGPVCQLLSPVIGIQSVF